jgi:hypothetical protein
MSWGDMQSGLSVFASWVVAGCKYVSQEEADRRGSVCSRCYLNSGIQGCAACHKAVETVVKGVKSKYDFALKACGICKCLLRAKIHFRMEDLGKNKEHQDLYLQVPHCWLNPQSENYRA